MGMVWPNGPNKLTGEMRFRIDPTSIGLSRSARLVLAVSWSQKLCSGWRSQSQPRGDYDMMLEPQA